MFIALGLLVSACGDDGGSDTGASDSGTAADEVGTSTEAGTEAGDTADTTTTAGTTEAETTAADTTEAGTTDTGTTDATTDTGTTDATTGDSPCTLLETADECAAMAGCQAVNGSKLKQNGPDAPCLEPEDFLGCIAEQACGDAISWFCQGNTMFQVNDTCGPDGASPCDAPVDPVAACP